MARPRKPASLNRSNSYSKSEKEEMAKREDELKGNDDLVMEVPDYLDDLAKVYYEFITTELKIADLLSNLDIPLVAQTADSISKMLQADEILRKEGIMVEEFDRNGNLITKEHPAVNTKLKYQREFRALLVQLGMSPSSRASLVALNADKINEENDPLLNLLNRHKGA